MKPMPWIKQSPNLLNNVSLLQLHDRQQLRYFQLYLLAGYLNAEGAFIQDGRQLSPKEIAHLLRVRDADQLAKDITVMKKVGLIKANGHGPYIAAFTEEQGDYIKKLEDHRERQKQYMKRKVTDVSVTHQPDVSDVSLTPLEQEQESEQEQDKSSSLLYTRAVEKFAESKITLKDDERISLAEIIPQIKPEWIGKAIKTALAKKKHSGAYVIGILKNWRDAHANNSSNNQAGATKPAQAKRSAATKPAASNATRAAAERIIANKRKADV